MMKTLDRRTFLAALGGAALAPAAPAAAPTRVPMTMWKHPSCGCCADWQVRVEQAFRGPMRVVPTADMDALKRARGVPQDLKSCHTALIGGYVVEGHVPPVDIQRLIRSRNRQVAGLAVPGMPLGAPGMDVGHNHREPYQVIAFGPGNRRALFARHG